MAITIFNDGDITVSTIAERNALTKRFDGMKVTVNDATGDATLGSGRACYQWDETNSNWGLVWSDVYKTIQFASESKLIVNGRVTADNVPADGKVWQARVIDSVSGVIIGEIKPTVNIATLDLGTTDYDGKLLEFSYAYGSISSQLQVLFDDFQEQLTNLEVGISGTQQVEIDALELSKQDKLISGETIKTINGESILAGGNVDTSTNITISSDSLSVIVASDTGSDGVITGATPVVAGIMTAAQSDKLAGIESGAQVNSVLSVAGRIGSVVLSKTDVGLDNVDNTADVNKSVASAATLATARTIALAGDVTGSVLFDGSQNVSIDATVVDYSHNHTIAEIDDLQTALDGKVDDSEKGVANGVATLDVNGKVVLTQIPDSILGQLQYVGTHNFSTGMPTATEKGQYWIASSSGNGYNTGDWAVYNGTTFDKVDNTDAVASVAGKIGVVTLDKNDVGLGNVDNTADVNKAVLSATKLATARTINGVSFDGTANITVADSTKEPAFTTLGVAKGGTGATSLTGLVKGNGTSAFTAAVAGTDYPALKGTESVYGGAKFSLSGTTLTITTT